LAFWLFDRWLRTQSLSRLDAKTQPRRAKEHKMTRKLFRTDKAETGRIEAFSDSVLAIVIAFLVLDIKVPAKADSDAALWQAIVERLPMIGAWLVSFFFVQELPGIQRGCGLVPEYTLLEEDDIDATSHGSFGRAETKLTGWAKPVVRSTLPALDILPTDTFRTTRGLLQP
jgi:hypothetical protein